MAVHSSSSNLSLPQKDIVRVYRKRAAIEDIIRELKGGFAFGKTDSSSFFANKARMWISVIASNLMRLMKSIALDDQQQSWTINTFRDRLLKIGGRVTKHARKVILTLDSRHPRTIRWSVLASLGTTKCFVAIKQRSRFSKK